MKKSILFSCGLLAVLIFVGVILPQGTKSVIFSFWFLITAALSDILFCQERKLASERPPLYTDEVVLGLLALGRALWLVSVVVIGLYNWRLLLALYLIAFLSCRIFLDGLVEQLVLIPFCRLFFFAFRGKKDRDSGDVDE
ncbi:MAG: hypothetical protein HYZ89_08250 [Candidatus Omnitrophica bacterium]|nr:hypothetical protein [Candidatus Omnitrophota bacterium]